MHDFLRKNQRLLQFGMVGASGVIVNMAGVWLTLRLLAVTPLAPDAQEAIASAAGILVSVFTNFVLNDLWTWADRAKGAWMARLLRYYAVSAAAGLVQFTVAVALSAGAQLDIYLAQLVGIVLGTGINYVANNAWTFRER